jgi:hypothetical protein
MCNKWSADLRSTTRIFFPTSVVLSEDYNFVGMILQILLRRINSGSFFLKAAAGKIVVTVFVPAATSSTIVIRILGSPTTPTKVLGYFSLAYWCCYFCRCWLTTLIVAFLHIALALRIRLKLWEVYCDDRFCRRRRKALEICSFILALFCNSWNRLRISLQCTVCYKHMVLI